MAFNTRNILAFNRGVISELGLARIDLDRMAMSAEIQRNYIPRVLGSMMLRPGMQYIDNTLANAQARIMPFIFEVDDTALIELTNLFMRVRIGDTLLSRPGVSTTVQNDDFTNGSLIWTDASDPGGTVFYAGTSFVELAGDGTDFGRIRQQVTVAGPDQGVEHSLFVEIDNPDALFKVGSSSGGDDYVSETRLGRGLHSLSFTPTGDFWIEFANERQHVVRIRECSIEAAGVVTLLTPWATEDLPFLRWDQSGDVIYVACKRGSTTGANANRLIRIERRGDGRSWSIITYEPKDGPFLTQNTSGITLAPDALNGPSVTITASQPVFDQNGHTGANFGALFRIDSNGQEVQKDISGADDFTDPIRVTGSANARQFQIVLSGTWTATVTLQFSFAEEGPWNDTDQVFTGNVDTTYNDGQDGSVIYYRIGVKSGDFTSGTVSASLIYANGSIRGIIQARGYISPTQISGTVFKPFGSLDPSRDWAEGAWSQKQGYPTAVAINEGRLTWAGNDRFWASVSDDYESFDEEVEGDSGPISRQISHGPIKVVHWLLSMARLLMGTSDTSANVAAHRMDGNSPLSVRSSNFDEPLTPFNFSIKPSSSRAVFVDRTEQRLYELLYDIDVQDYKSADLSVFAPDFNQVGIKQIAVQMKPDLRVHCVRNDGTVGMLIYDRLENVMCWIDVDSPGAGGEIEDVAVLPGRVEDQVYYTVKRTIDGNTERHICKWAQESEAEGGTVNKIADSFVYYSGVATTTITGLDHLEGEDVIVWADGADVGTATVSSGQITLATAASDVIVGLGYTAQFKSAKLGELTGISLLEPKKVNRIGFLARKLHHLGVQYGPSFSQLYDLPQVEEGQVVAADTVYDSYHEEDFPFGGEWDPDSRICLQSQAPRPATILAAIADFVAVETPDRR